jgi:4-hydroxybenzoate polyprenyltransferase
MEKLARYASFVKVEHTLFSLPLILSGVFLGSRGFPGLKPLFLILLAGFGARTVALGVNRIIDRRIDGLNPRTRSRELPSRRMSLGEALGVVAFGLAVYFVAAFFICRLVFYLSPLPIVVFLIYPYMKRFTPLCHFGVGLGLALAPIAGYVAASCSFEGAAPALLLSLFTLLWVSGFDIIYATLDEEFDKSHGVYSLVARYGRRKALFVSGVLHLLSFLSLVVIHAVYLSGIPALVFLLVAGFLLYAEHRRAHDVDLAFFKINAALGFVVFLFVLSGIYLA